MKASAKEPEPKPARKTVVLIVCGGVKISLDEMKEYDAIAKKIRSEGLEYEVQCNGENWRIPV